MRFISHAVHACLIDRGDGRGHHDALAARRDRRMDHPPRALAGWPNKHLRIARRLEAERRGDVQHIAAAFCRLRPAFVPIEIGDSETQRILLGGDSRERSTHVQLASKIADRRPDLPTVIQQPRDAPSADVAGAARD